jgi:hypothetical protein
MLALSNNADHRLIDTGYGNGCITRARSHPTGEEQASFAALVVQGVIFTLVRVNNI